MDTHARLGAHRALRRELEEAVLPLAGSVDGRAFSFQASLHGLRLQVGGYAAIETEEGTLLGQVQELETATRDAAELALAGEDGAVATAPLALRLAVGTGTLLEGAGTPFHDGAVRPAEPAEVAAWLERGAPRRARLDVGELALVPGVPLALDAGGFDRHTFLCGQSGSGKTYALGVLLERLLLETTLRIVVLDPSSEHVRIGEVRGDVPASTASRYRRVASFLDVHRAGAGGGARLRLRFGELEPAAQSALLRLDPVADLHEHAALDEIVAAERPPTLEAFLASERAGEQQLGLRVRNLGIDRLGLWARSDPGTTLEAAGDTGRRGLIVDLGSLPTRTEQALTAAAVLGRLWERREERAPVLIVIDDAHDVCPAEPQDRLTALATEHAVRIAAEGRRYGLYLLVCTQRPQKVHPNVVTQCDNLVLMRLASAADTAYAQEVFSHVPAGLLARAPALGLGEAVVAGRICRSAALLRFGRRLSHEGGADVPSDWAAG
jgi:hypothetical protein